MIYHVSVGTGSPGKLWTGSPEFFSGADESPRRSGLPGRLGRYARVEFVQFRSPRSGVTTRRLFIREEFAAKPEGLRIPELLICTGGVGSLCESAASSDDDWRRSVVVWNWSGRVGGYVIVDPVARASGYVSEESLNESESGYAWIHTYHGSTLDEFVLVQLDEDGAVHPRHRIPVGREMFLLSPPEREQDALAETFGLHGDAVVTVEDAVAAGMCRDGSARWLADSFPGRDSVTLAELKPYADRDAMVRSVFEFKLRQFVTK